MSDAVSKVDWRGFAAKITIMSGERLKAMRPNAKYIRVNIDGFVWSAGANSMAVV